MARRMRLVVAHPLADDDTAESFNREFKLYGFGTGIGRLEQKTLLAFVSPLNRFRGKDPALSLSVQD